MPKNVSVDHIDSAGNVIAFTTAPSCGTSEAAKLIVSSDGGKSFKTIADAAQNDFFTSIKISNDGKSVIVAMLDSTSRKNQVGAYRVSGQKASLIFTAEKSGVFLHADINGVVYFTQGCYQCDGGRDPDLLTYSSKTSSVKTIATIVGLLGKVTFTNKANKALIESITPGDGLGGELPVDFYEFKTGDNTLTKLHTEGSSFPTDSGYRTVTLPI